MFNRRSLTTWASGGVDPQLGMLQMHQQKMLENLLPNNQLPTFTII